MMKLYIANNKKMIIRGFIHIIEGLILVLSLGIIRPNLTYKHARRLLYKNKI
jgi:hypothetical protein